MNAEEIMQKLMEGNKRFVSGERKDYDFKTRRHELINGQNPFATVITCSDSRVIPEFIFDVNIGEIFKIETAGNVVGPIGLGSVEYGVEHLKTPILMVLGHSKCGAVTACCQTNAPTSGNLGEIMKKIEPATLKEEKQVEPAIDENLQCVKNCLLNDSPVIKKAVSEGTTKLILAKYLIETGEVKVLE